MSTSQIVFEKSNQENWKYSCSNFNVLPLNKRFVLSLNRTVNLFKYGNSESWDSSHEKSQVSDRNQCPNESLLY